MSGLGWEVPRDLSDTLYRAQEGRSPSRLRGLLTAREEQDLRGMEEVVIMETGLAEVPQKRALSSPDSLLSHEKSAEGDVAALRLTVRSQGFPFPNPITIIRKMEKNCRSLRSLPSAVTQTWKPDLRARSQLQC